LLFFVGYDSGHTLLGTTCYKFEKHHQQVILKLNLKKR